MARYRLYFQLITAATFGRGDGVAGLVDREVEHDRDGLPFLRGRTLRGLLAEECANLLPYLEQADPAAGWRQVAWRMFGTAGSTTEDMGRLRVGNAGLPPDLCAAVHDAVDDRQNSITATAVLESLTAVRRQTSIDDQGAPEAHSLRSMRVVLPGVLFVADLVLPDPELPHERELLGLCTLAWRRAGTGRNRGRGRLQAWLCDDQEQDITQECFATIKQEVLP